MRSGRVTATCRRPTSYDAAKPGARSAALPRDFCHAAFIASDFGNDDSRQVSALRHCTAIAARRPAAHDDLTSRRAEEVFDMRQPLMLHDAAIIEQPEDDILSDDEATIPLKDIAIGTFTPFKMVPASRRDVQVSQA